MLADLKKAITLYCSALKLYLSDYSEQSNLLLNLAIYKFDKQSILTNLEEAITLHYYVLKLCLFGHSDQFNILINFANCLKK